MDIQTLKDLVDKISEDNNIAEEALYEELIDILKLKYSVTLMEKERAVIDELRNKILTRLYNTDGHVLDRGQTDEQKYYKLDAVEHRYVDQALAEMAKEGLVENNKTKTVLTEAGILKYRGFYGEI